MIFSPKASFLLIRARQQLDVPGIALPLPLFLIRSIFVPRKPRPASGNNNGNQQLCRDIDPVPACLLSHRTHLTHLLHSEPTPGFSNAA
jgi:hypothetical protein